MTDLTRTDLWQMLGTRPPDLRQVDGGVPEAREGIGVETLRIASSRRSFPALRLSPPAGAPRRMPLIYCHAHGNHPEIGKAEAVDGRPALLDPPLAVALARAGHPVLCPDMPGFGARQSEGAEAALAKACLWRGETLLGHMLEDLSVTLDAVLNESPGPVGSVGFSMGAFLSVFLAALRPEVAACAHLCGVAALAPLIASGAHDLHGPYLTVPGLLREHDLPDVAALVAPRPQFLAGGLGDPLTPPDALHPALDRLSGVYGGSGALRVHIERKQGHVETPEMRAALLAFLADAVETPVRG